MPPQIGELSNLNTLWVSSNKFTGALPRHFGKLERCSSLNLRDNGFSGTIPPQFGKLTQLSLLRLDINFLTGLIPASFNNVPGTAICSLQPGNPDLGCSEDPDTGATSGCAAAAAAVPCKPPPPPPLSPPPPSPPPLPPPPSPSPPPSPPPPLSPSPPSPPPSTPPPPLEEVVKLVISPAASSGGGGARRALRVRLPLSRESIIAYVLSRMPTGVSLRDISVIAVRRVPGGRRLQSSSVTEDADASGFDYFVSIFIRGDMSGDEVLAIVSSTDFAQGLEEAIDVPLVVSDITKEVGLVPSPFLPPSLPPPSRPPSPPAPPFTCLDFESMNEVRETGQWCSTVARDNDPEACNNAYAITFPSDNFSPGYFSKPRRYRTPDVRVQRQRCTHNNLEGPDAKCKLDDRKYQCAVPRSFNCSGALANDIQRPGPSQRWCSAQTTKNECEASYARSGDPWVLNGIRGRNYRPCEWVEGSGCRLGDVGINCRDPDDGEKCIDVWHTVATDGQTCGDLARARAQARREGLRNAAVNIGNAHAACSPCATAP